MASTENGNLIKKYDRHNLIVNVFLIPVTVFFGLVLFYTEGLGMIKVIKEIKYAQSISEETASSKFLNGNTVSQSTVYHQAILDFRNNKLDKIKAWESKDRKEELVTYKKFYDLQIMRTGVNDFEFVATELAGIANKIGLQIVGINAGTYKFSQTVQLKGDTRFEIYERPFTIDLKEGTVADYEKVKEFLRVLRDDIKMPYNTSFELSSSKEIGKEVTMDRITILFFYKNEKKKAGSTTTTSSN